MNYDLSLEEIAKLDCNPTTNPNAIVLEKQVDGNWRGFMFKNGKVIQERQGDPHNVLGLLITHP